MKTRILKSLFAALAVVCIIMQCSKVNAQNNYTKVDSTTLFERSTVNTYIQNLFAYPQLSVNNMDYRAEVVEGSRRLWFTNTSPGQKLKGNITAEFKLGALLNNKSVNLKVEYSDIVLGDASDTSYLTWTKCASTQTDENRWKFHNVKSMNLKVSLVNQDNSTVHLDRAYLTMDIKDAGETVSSSNASNQYVKNNNLKYMEESNSFQYGTGAGSVCYEYKDQDTMNISLSDTKVAPSSGYHIKIGAFTAEKPEDPKLEIDKTEAKPGEDVVLTTTQKLAKALSEDFHYKTYEFVSDLNENFEYKSLQVLNAKGVDITNEAGKIVQEGNQVKYVFNEDYLKNLEYKSQELKFILTVTVKDDATPKQIPLSTKTVINGDSTFNSNNKDFNSLQKPIPEFNLAVSQNIGKVIVNNNNNIFNNNFAKVELYQNEKIESLKIFYNINVSNPSEVEGKTDLVEQIPEGYTMLPEENPEWEINGNTAKKQIESVAPNETKEYQVILTGQKEEYYGEVGNNVLLENVSNAGNYEEKGTEDNRSSTTLLVSMATGLQNFLNKGQLLLNILLFCGIILYSFSNGKGCRKCKNCIIKKNT